MMDEPGLGKFQKRVCNSSLDNDQHVMDVCTAFAGYESGLVVFGGRLRLLYGHDDDYVVQAWDLVIFFMVCSVS